MFSPVFPSPFSAFFPSVFLLPPTFPSYFSLPFFLHPLLLFIFPPTLLSYLSPFPSLNLLSLRTFQPILSHFPLPPSSILLTSHTYPPQPSPLSHPLLILTFSFLHISPPFSSPPAVISHLWHSTAIWKRPGGKYLSFGSEPFDPSVDPKKYSFSREGDIYSITISNVGSDGKNSLYSSSL